MGFVSKLFSSILGGSTPKVSNQASGQVQADKKKTKSARAALYRTEGGQAGQELDPEQVKKRDTLFGN